MRGSFRIIDLRAYEINDELSAKDLAIIEEVAEQNIPLVVLLQNIGSFVGIAKIGTDDVIHLCSGVMDDKLVTIAIDSGTLITKSYDLTESE